jgi:diaminohydroxyphosphoribosylaminopyrimidine deaminase/5-amino-6-(5-phosphoribosylamino)uracil reductase
VSWDAAEDAAMVRAIALSRIGLGETSPNPSVGAVIIDASGTIIGEGRTAPAGGPHAEIQALRQAGDKARGATAVVSLEPCNHTGRTGPCAQALIDAGVSRVVVAIEDPNIEAAGGLGALRAAGVDTQLGVRAADAEHALRYWLTAVRRRRPYVIWKFAATLDGRSAAADGTSQWITSEAARADVHQLRGTVDAIIAGVGTVLADDPSLTVRVPGLDRRPLRVVVDSDGRTPEDARVRDDAAPTWIATAADVGRHDIDTLLAALFRRGVRSALLEGGPTLAGAFLQSGHVDEVVAYVAPKLLGAGPAAVGDAGIKTIADVVELEVADVTRLGPDLRISGTPKGVR